MNKKDNQQPPNQNANTFPSFYFVTFSLPSKILSPSFLYLIAIVFVVVKKFSYSLDAWDKRDDWSYNLFTRVTISKVCIRTNACRICTYFHDSAEAKIIPSFFLTTKFHQYEILVVLFFLYHFLKFSLGTEKWVIKKYI